MSEDTKTLKPADDQSNWHALTAQQILEQLATPIDTGLSTDEAAKRLESYGPNQLREAPGKTFLQMLLDQFKDFIVIMLIVVSTALVLGGVPWGLGVMLVTGVAIIVAAGAFRCPRCNAPFLYEGPIYWAHPTFLPNRCRNCGQPTNELFHPGAEE